FLQPSAGDIFISGKSINDDPIGTSRYIGYLPEHNPLYDELIVYDYLKYIAELRDMKEVVFDARLTFVVEKCGLKAVMAQPIGTLSKGYRQRVGLAQAIIHDPDILILDEPTSGLDPNQIMDIRDLIRELGTEKTVILSSHIMQEVQALCDRVIIINKGKIIADDTKDKLRSQFSSRIEVEVEIEGEEPDVSDLLAEQTEISILQSSSEEGLCRMVFESAAEYDLKREVAMFLSKKGLLVLGIHQKQHSLEDVFHSLTSQGNLAILDSAILAEEPVIIDELDDSASWDEIDESGAKDESEER
ncbi:MAG: ATP-binding cassette domain-containing protein, partial [Candidatus Cloacimonadaceae bacterium]|nr:ATP-binding cassette domain-containing protein [Candidatus Cloacimonadaceae bacterium]